jgi:SNF2 family DNA or RNA helicase
MTGTPGTVRRALSNVRKVLTPANLRAYQWRAIRFVQHTLNAALFLDMGLGKTVSVLTLIKWLLLRPQDGVRTWLVVAPLRVVHGVWRQEAAKWTHTQDVVFSVVHGNEKRRRAALEAPAHVYLINPEGLVWLIEMMHRLKLDKPGLWPFDGLCVDESSMFKSSQTKRWKKLATVLHLFKRRLILTGTPTPNSLLELWPQIYLLDMGERLGNSFYRFRERFFKSENIHNEHARMVPRRGTQRRMEDMVNDIVLRLDAADWLQLPPLIGLSQQLGGPGDVVVDMPDAAMEQYQELEKEMFLELLTSDVEAISAAALSQKCHQFANGALYGDHRDTGDKTWEPVHDAKLDALEEIVDECGGPLLVCYQFRHDLARLKARFKRFADVSTMDVKQFEQEWNSGRWPGALVHPRSAGHGSNWQDGGTDIAFFSLTWSKEQIDQVVARIGPTRQAQAGRTKPVKAYRIITRGTVDEVIIDSNALKDRTQRGLLNALRDYANEKYKRSPPAGRGTPRRAR